MSATASPTHTPVTPTASDAAIDDRPSRRVALLAAWAASAAIAASALVFAASPAAGATDHAFARPNVRTHQVAPAPTSPRLR